MGTVHGAPPRHIVEGGSVDTALGTALSISQPLSRRALLLLSGCALRCGSEGGVLRPVESAVDHLLLGVADLDRGIEWVEEKTRVRAVIGGSHPGVGTRNALISLGGRRYLEIIAPDPAQEEYRSHIDVRSFTEPRIVTWAASTTDIEALAGKAQRAGYSIEGPSDGSRARPDGKLLRWKTLDVSAEFGRQGIDPVPFFIEWAADSTHPAEDSPKGCELRSIEIEHPDAEAVAGLLAGLGVEADVKQGPDPRIIAMLDTPKGDVRLW